MNRSLALAVLTWISACLPSSAWAQRKEFKLPDDVELTRDVVFGKGGGRDLNMHLLVSKKSADKPRPVIVWVHGGGWEGGHRDTGIPRLAAFASEGYFCASVEYRLSKEAVFPAQI